MHTSGKKKRTSQASQVVEKAKRLNAEQGNVENLPSTRLEQGTNGGNTTLMAIFPRKGGGEPQRSLMASPNSPTRGHPKFPQAARSDYDASAWMTKRAAASLSL